MALFKILKGNSLKLPEVKVTEGYAYFTPDDGKFYIDIGETGSSPVVGNNSGEIDSAGNQVNRICINQRTFSYNDYDILDCGTADVDIEINPIIFDCGSSTI